MYDAIITTSKDYTRDDMKDNNRESTDFSICVLHSPTIGVVSLIGGVGDDCPEGELRYNLYV